MCSILLETINVGNYVPIALVYLSESAGIYVYQHRWIVLVPTHWFVMIQYVSYVNNKF